MGGVAVAVEEGDGERAHARIEQLPCRGAHALLIERQDDVAARADALLHGLSQRSRDERGGALERKVESVVAKLVADLEHVAIAFRGDEPDGRTAPLDQGVGDERRAVHHLLRPRRHRGKPLEDGARRIIRRGEELVERERARLRVVKRKVGEGAADVGAREIACHRP